MVEIASELKKNDSIRRLHEMSFLGKKLESFDSAMVLLRNNVNKTVEEKAEKYHYSGDGFWGKLIAGFKNIFAKAVKFQPELYRLIQLCATRQDIQKMQQQQLVMIRSELEAQTKSIRYTLQQDGSVREKFFSDCSKMLSDSRQEMKSIVEDLQINIRKIVVRTAASSILLSVLACILLQHLLS